MEFPEQLKPLAEDAEKEEDVRPVGLGQGRRPYLNMNQSVFGLIGAIQSNVDFNNRFEGYSSEEEDADDSGDERHSQKSKHDLLRDPTANTTTRAKEVFKDNKGHRRKLSNSKLMKSVPILSKLSSKSWSKKEGKKPVSQIQEESDPEERSSADLEMSTGDDNNLAPVMSRMLEARAEAAERPSFDIGRKSTDAGRETSDLTEPTHTELSTRLQKIFEFDEPEDLISGWLPTCTFSSGAGTDVHPRISVLVASGRASPRLYLYHDQAHMLLRIPSQEGSGSTPVGPRTDFAYSIPAPSYQVRLPIEIGQAGPKVQQVLVPAQG